MPLVRFGFVCISFGEMLTMGWCGGMGGVCVLFLLWLSCVFKVLLYWFYNYFANLRSCGEGLFVIFLDTLSLPYLR